jgi:GntR family transcriptional regulator, transcriptional repressor for pyruvate dehydrogenase complex
MGLKYEVEWSYQMGAETMTDGLYHKFTRERLYEQVADHIDGLISSGKLKVGDRLPPERELAERLGVARGVVREAVKLLSVKGLVTVEPGRGTFIVERGAESISDHLSRLSRMGRITLGDLNELRRMLEIEIAALAAERARPEDVARLSEAIEAMDASSESPEDYISADLSFHLALANATQNQMFSLLIGVIVDLLQESRRLIFHVPGAPQRGQVWHRRIAEAVVAGDSAGARDAMLHHLEQITADSSVGAEHIQAADVSSSSLR